MGIMEKKMENNYNGLYMESKPWHVSSSAPESTTLLVSPSMSFEGFRVLGFRVEGLRVLGFRVLGF